jgi:hypothetical protein
VLTVSESCPVSLLFVLKSVVPGARLSSGTKRERSKNRSPLIVSLGTRDIKNW